MYHWSLYTTQNAPIAVDSCCTFPIDMHLPSCAFNSSKPYQNCFEVVSTILDNVEPIGLVYNVNVFLFILFSLSKCYFLVFWNKNQGDFLNIVLVFLTRWTMGVGITGLRKLGKIFYPAMNLSCPLWVSYFAYGLPHSVSQLWLLHSNLYRAHPWFPSGPLQMTL